MKRVFRFSIVFVCLLILTALFLQAQHAVSAGESENADLSTFGGASSGVTRFLVLGKDRSAGLADCIMIVRRSLVVSRAGDGRLLDVPM